MSATRNSVPSVHGVRNVDALGFIDAPAWRRLAAAAVGDQSAELVTCSVVNLYGLGATAQIYRASGEVQIRGGRVAWSAVIKVFAASAHGLHAASDDPTAWNYVKREWLAYQAPWFGELDAGLVAPRCLGFGTAADGSTWVGMADLAEFDRRPWTLDQFAQVARDLGRFNASFLASRPLPTDTWLSVNWIRRWTERSDPVTALKSAGDNSLVREIVSASMASALEQLWNDREDYFAALAALPQTLCHHDVFARNAFLEPYGSGVRTVAIDWAYCGYGPLGADLAPLIEASMTWFEAEQLSAEALEAACLAGYLDGLRGAGINGSERDVHLGYVATVVLRSGLGSLASIVAIMLDDSLHPPVEKAFGRPIQRIVMSLRAMMDFLERRIPRARQLLDQRQ